ncbi:PfkB family carbohydrate kinase [Microbacterium sp. lyk4-40-TSB-66]|uniref:carbohydrate kinase family protein n=1 Tax=Microbacterium sp. lyk4-40-TSB-66 TaxID=3040294 RepID=UPI00254EB449|nr:PfkB family carbohydrate kinase [Microbacterium sp. lyk4-40-TSB-66]
MTASVSPPRALVIGEALIDIVDRGGAESAYVGGSPLNVAVGLSRLGVETTFATEFAGDDHGRLIAEHVDAAHVAVVQTAVEATRTSTARARIGADGSATYDFDLSWEFARPPRTDGFSIVHVGSVGALRSPGADRVVELVEALPRDVLVSFDPNVRPALLASVDATRDLVHRYAARANVVKLSDEDAEWLYPDDPSSAAGRLLEQGAAIVVVTRGEQGSTLSTRAGDLHVPGHAVDVVDTIGAGDSYMSGLIAALVRGIGLERLIEGRFVDADLAAAGRAAAVAAGITVSRAGAAPPTTVELDAALALTGVGAS